MGSWKTKECSSSSDQFHWDGVCLSLCQVNLQWISTHFGCASVEISWELRNYVTEFAVSLFLMTIKLRTLKWKPQVWSWIRFEICELRFQVGKAAVGMACAEEDESDKSWLSTFKILIVLEIFTWIYETQSILYPALN